jgi:hypothetical protein
VTLKAPESLQLCPISQIAEAQPEKKMQTENKKRIAYKAMVTRVLAGDGKASLTQRRAAFDDAMPAGPLGTLVNKFAKNAYKVTDEDITAVKALGLSEEQIFEMVVCAAIGQSTRQYESALAALDAALGED